MKKTLILGIFSLLLSMSFTSYGQSEKNYQKVVLVNSDTVKGVETNTVHSGPWYGLWNYNIVASVKGISSASSIVLYVRDRELYSSTDINADKDTITVAPGKGATITGRSSGTLGAQYVDFYYTSTSGDTAVVNVIMSLKKIDNEAP